MARSLDRLNASNSSGVAFQRLWQRNCEAVEANFTDITQLVTDLAAAVADIAAAQAAADAAQTAADDAATDAAAAQSTADIAKRDHSIATSYVYPGNCLTAADVGATATITVAAHARRYGDISDVSVNGGTITGLGFGVEYHVYYDQTSRAGGAVTYSASANPNHAAPGKAAGRHYVGTITTPADGAASTTGGFGMPSSGGEIMRGQIGGTG